MRWEQNGRRAEGRTGGMQGACARERERVEKNWKIKLEQSGRLQDKTHRAAKTASILTVCDDIGTKAATQKHRAEMSPPPTHTDPPQSRDDSHVSIFLLISVSFYSSFTVSLIYLFTLVCCLI